MSDRPDDDGDDYKRIFGLIREDDRMAFRVFVIISNTEAYDDETKTAQEWFVSWDALEDAMPFLIAPDDKTLLLELFSRSPPSWTPSTALKDFEGVTLDNDGKVTKVDLRGKNLTGTIDLSKLPQGLQELYLHNNQLTGPVDLTKLPQGLQELYLNDNRLTGPLNLTKLPQGLQVLNLSDNRLTGPLNLTKLPQGLRRLYLQNNQLTGPVDLTKLPQGLQGLDIRNNQLTGPVDLTNLPQGLRMLDLGNNQLTGPVDLTKLPQGLQELHLSYNGFSPRPACPPGFAGYFFA